MRSNLGYRFLYEPKVYDLNRAIKEYEIKLQEIKDLVHIESEKFQEISNKKETAIKDFDDTKLRKSELLLVIKDIEGKIVSANKSLKSEIETRHEFIENSHTKNRKERQMIEDTRIDVVKEISNARNSLEAEMKRRITEMELAKAEFQKEVISLEGKKLVLTARISELNKETQIAQDLVKGEKDRMAKIIEEYRGQTEKEIHSLVEKKNTLISKVKTLGQELGIGSDIAGLSKELADKRKAAENEISVYNQDILTIEKQHADLVTRKDSLHKEVEEIQRIAMVEAGEKEQTIMAIKTSYELELKTLAERKQALSKKNETVEKDLLQSYRLLENEKGKRDSFLQSFQREYVAENERLSYVKSSLKGLYGQIEELEPVVKELQGFIAKSLDARADYLEEQKKLNTAQKEREHTLKEIEATKAFVAQEKKDMDGTKQYLQDFYGRIATYVKIAKKTIEYVNITLQETPLRFQIPPDLEEIKFNNFNKKYKL